MIKISVQLCEGSGLFNDTLNTFSYGHMASDNSMNDGSIPYTHLISRLIYIDQVFIFTFLREINFAIVSPDYIF